MTETVETDAAVIARSRDDPTAFATVFDRHYDVIHRFLWGRVGDAAEDITAEVFKVAFERRRDYDENYPSAKPWLFGIASRLAKQHHRTRARVRELRERAKADTEASAVAGPEQRLQELALSSPLAEALMRLPDRDRDPLLMLAWGDMTYEEISQAMEVPLGTVRSRIHRARRVLQERLADQEPDERADGRSDHG